MLALGAPPTDDDDRVNLDGQVDNHAELAPSQLVSGEATGRVATTAAMAIASTLGNRLLMPIQCDQNWRKRGGQDDPRMFTTERNGPQTQDFKARSSSCARAAQTGAGF